jgi:hypothetical protein
MREHSFIFLNKKLPKQRQGAQNVHIRNCKKKAWIWEGNCRSGGVDPQTGGGGKARSVGRGGGTGSMEGLGK